MAHGDLRSLEFGPFPVDDIEDAPTVLMDGAAAALAWEDEEAVMLEPDDPSLSVAVDAFRPEEAPPPPLAPRGAVWLGWAAVAATGALALTLVVAAAVAVGLTL